MTELKTVLSDIVSAVDKTVTAVKENRTRVNNSVLSLNGAVGNINIENILISLVDPGEYTAFEVTAGLTPIVSSMPDAMTHALEMKIARLSIGTTLGDTSSIGSFDVVIDWGDGTTTSPSDMTLLGDGDTNDYINKLKWSDEDSSYGMVYTDQSLRAYYSHTYTTPGKYIVKILGTTYFQIRHSSSYQKNRNLISRCLEYDLPLYSGLKRLQGTFAHCVQVTNINCPSYYRWPDELIDCTSALENCVNLVSVGDMKLPETVRSTLSFFKGCKALKKGILVPDRTTNVSQMYSDCSSILSIPNIGTNVQNMDKFAIRCSECKYIGGKIPKTTKYAIQAFTMTYKLEHAPDIDPETVFGWADDLDLTTLDELTYYNLKSADKTKAICYMFGQSGIITPPSTLGNVLGSVVDASQLFSDCQRLRYIPVIPEGVTNCTKLCYNCYSLTSCGMILGNSAHINNNTIPSTCTDMTNAFRNCYSLKSAPVIPANVQSCAYTFAGCRSLTYAGTVLSSTTNLALTDCSYMFNSCHSLLYGPQLPPNVTTLLKAFLNCYSLVYSQGLRGLNNLTKLQNISYICTRCYSLLYMYCAIPDSVKNAAHAFSYCEKAEKLPYFTVNSTCLDCTAMYTSSMKMNNSVVRLPKTVTSAASFMSGCGACIASIATIIPSLFTNSGIDLNRAFYSCSSLTGTQENILSIGTVLWNASDASTKFVNTEQTFAYVNSAIRQYIPETWCQTA